MNTSYEYIANVWPSIKSTLAVPHTEEEYENQVLLLDNLLDEVGEDENHPLASLIETIGSLVESYEAKNFELPSGNPVEALRYLMQEHGLKQADLQELGSQGVVSEILQGKRKLNIRQIKELSARFNVSPLVFM
jgi:HTH-type transcriptional regulator/antitoxin HigA